MFPITRLFESEEAARAAIARLDELEVSPDAVIIVNADAADAAAVVESLIEAGKARSGHRIGLRQALERGRTIVSVSPEWGMGSAVENTLENNGAVDSETIADYNQTNPSPFSDFFGLPVLTRGKSQTDLFEFDADSSFGLSLISNGATPLSSLFGMKVLSKHKSAKGTSVEKMAGTAAPLSSKIGMKLLKSSQGAKGTAVERMASNPAPFSRFLGLPVLTRRQ